MTFIRTLSGDLGVSSPGTLVPACTCVCILELLAFERTHTHVHKGALSHTPEPSLLPCDFIFPKRFLEPHCRSARQFLPCSTKENQEMKPAAALFTLLANVTMPRPNHCAGASVTIPRPNRGAALTCANTPVKYCGRYKSHV